MRPANWPSGQSPFFNTLGEFAPGDGHFFKYGFRLGIRSAGGHGLAFRGTETIPLNPGDYQLSHDSRPHFALGRTNAVIEI